MKNAVENTQKLADFAPKVGGVFSLLELGALFDISNQQSLWIAARRFEAASVRIHTYRSGRRSLITGSSAPKVRSW